MSRVEVTDVSNDGLRLSIGTKKRFVSFDKFPWFRNASIAQITHVTLPSPQHLYWPDLDVDLSVESIDHPGRYPLMSRVPAKPRSRGRR